MIDTSQKFQIVLAAFGTSTGSSAIYANLLKLFEERFKQTIPMGFTSRVGDPKLKNVLAKLPPDKMMDVVIVPLVMIPGRVFLDDIKRLAEEYETSFKSVRVAKPLLPDERIFDVLKEELLPELNKPKLEETGILFVGHGTPDNDSSQIYIDCAQKVKSLFPHSMKVAFGNVEFSAPYCKDVLGELIMSDIKTLIIQPFMIVDGVHIHDDIKGALDGDHHDNNIYHHLLDVYGEPLKKRLELMEFIYKPGLGAYRGVFELFADHTIKALSGNGCC